MTTQTTAHTRQQNPHSFTCAHTMCYRYTTCWCFCLSKLSVSIAAQWHQSMVRRHAIAWETACSLSEKFTVGSCERLFSSELGAPVFLLLFISFNNKENLFFLPTTKEANFRNPRLLTGAKNRLIHHFPSFFFIVFSLVVSKRKDFRFCCWRLVRIDIYIKGITVQRTLLKAAFAMKRDVMALIF